MEFMTVAVAVVAIRSVHTGLYLSITSHGDLVGTVRYILNLNWLHFRTENIETVDNIDTVDNIETIQF